MATDPGLPSDPDRTGLAGVVGDAPETVGAIADAMHPAGSRGRTERSTDVVDALGVHVSEHPAVASALPADVSGHDAHVWVVGEVYGARRDAGYLTRPGGVDDAAFVADELGRGGLDAVSGLNGHFVAVVHDRAAGTVSVATDRLGSRPVHYARPEPGTFAFATGIQALANHGAVEPAFDAPNLLQYLRYRRVVGTGTPLDGVRTLPPASVTTVDPDGGTATTRRYWEPRFRPMDRPFEYFVDRFAETFQTVIGEWVDPDRDYGVMLSGGSDSRLLLAAMEAPSVTAYHVGGWRNREAEVAERVAREAGCEFQFLELSGRAEGELLERTAARSNFEGSFDQGYALAFRERLAAEVDALASGLYADTLFKGASIPKPRVRVGPLGSVTLPVAERLDGPHALVERSFRHGDAAPRPSSVADGVEDPLLDGLSVEGDRIGFHGVEYPDYATFRVARSYYPLSNHTELAVSNAMGAIAPYRSPFLDDRLIDLQLRMPIRYQLRRDVVARALERLAPELAAIPHEPDGTPLNTSFPVRYAVKHARALGRKLRTGPTPPEPYLGQRSRRDHRAFVRESDFFPETLETATPAIEGVDALDAAGAHSALSAHRSGEDRTAELHALLTALSMPVTREVAGADAGDVVDDREAAPGVGDEGDRVGSAGPRGPRRPAEDLPLSGRAGPL